MKKIFAKLYQKLTGWEIVGKLPKDIKNAVVIAVPHTSNYDFYQGLLIFWALDFNVKFLIKDYWTKKPIIGWWMKSIGAIGVDRSQKDNSVLMDHLKELFKKQDANFQLMITPEGSRKSVEKWKTGFYRIATDLNIPIFLCFTDSKTKTCGFGEVFYPTGDFEKDMTYIQTFYLNFTARVPENYNPKIF